MKQRIGDAWDGFDRGEYVYNESSEKKYHSTLWKVLAGVFLLTLLVLTVSLVKELTLVFYGQKIEADYYVDSNGRAKAGYYDADRNFYAYDFTGMEAVHDEDSITLYYTDNIRKAVLRTPWWYWARRYTFFLVLAGFSIWRIYKIYHKPLY